MPEFPLTLAGVSKTKSNRLSGHFNSLMDLKSMQLSSKSTWHFECTSKRTSTKNLIHCHVTTLPLMFFLSFIYTFSYLFKLLLLCWCMAKFTCQFSKHSSNCCCGKTLLIGIMC